MTDHYSHPDYPRHIYFASHAEDRAAEYPADSLANAAWTAVKDEALTVARLVGQGSQMYGALHELRLSVVLRNRLAKLVAPASDTPSLPR